jgi:curved DNA-binding protein CbpA
MFSDKDKRRFRRYKFKSDIKLSSGKTEVKASITDYSLKGIGFSIDTIPAITSGSNVRFKIEGLSLEDEGEIVWSRDFNLRLKGGIERKSISGRLRHFPLADVLIDLQRSEKNGILEVTSGAVTKRIYIRTGDMVFAVSTQEEDRFVEVLLRAGKITTDQYYQVINISQKKGKSHGATLVELAYLKPEDLVWAVRSQVEEIILSLFQWKDGTFTFLDGPVFSDRAIRLKLSAANLIYRGIKRIGDSQCIMKAMPPEDTILGYSKDPLYLFQDISLDKNDQDILRLLDGRRTIKEILSASTLDNFRTMKTLYALISTRMIDIGETSSPEDNIRENIFKEVEPEENPDFMKEVEHLYANVDSMDYYSFLGVERWATMDKIRKAYYRAAKEFHPDKHLHLTSDTLKNKLNAIFSHLTGVYKILTDPKERREYDRLLQIKPVRLRSGTEKKSNTELATARYSEGKEAFRRESYAEAEALFSQATYLDSLKPAYHFHLALALVRENKFREAGKSINEALKLNPGNADYLAELGHIYLKLGFRLRARSAFEKALKSDPSNKRAAGGMQKVRDRPE